MRRFLGMAFVAALSTVVTVDAEEIKSGLQPGKFIGPFYVTKQAGAAEDGVDVGENLCYRCKYGGRPQVMVFTRSADKNVVQLVQKLDAAVKHHSDAELSAFVNLLGEDKDQLLGEADELAKASQVSSVPLVVPNEFENGPENYGLNPKADVTIILAGSGKVAANHAFASAKDVDIEKVLADVEKILN